jgi:hypothetical protein
MTATRHPFNSEELAMHERVAALTLKSARPLIWHDVREPWTKRLLGGTCFILRFDAGLIGITAAHVVGAFEDAVRRNSNVVSLLRTVHFGLKKAIIDRDESLDITQPQERQHSDGVAGTRDRLRPRDRFNRAPAGAPA